MDKNLKAKLAKVNEHLNNNPNSEFFKAYNERPGDFSTYKQLIDSGYVLGTFNDKYKFKDSCQVKIYTLTTTGLKKLRNPIIVFLEDQWLTLLSLLIALIALFKWW